MPTAERFAYGFEEGTHSCWSVRLDNNVSQGNPTSYTADLAYEGNGALRFSFNLSATPAHRAQIKYENMPFAGTFSARVCRQTHLKIVASFYVRSCDVE